MSTVQCLLWLICIVLAIRVEAVSQLMCPRYCYANLNRQLHCRYPDEWNVCNVTFANLAGSIHQCSGQNRCHVGLHIEPAMENHVWNITMQCGNATHTECLMPRTNIKMDKPKAVTLVLDNIRHNTYKLQWKMGRRLNASNLIYNIHTWSYTDVGAVATQDIYVNGSDVIATDTSGVYYMIVAIPSFVQGLQYHVTLRIRPHIPHNITWSKYSDSIIVIAQSGNSGCYCPHHTGTSIDNAQASMINAIGSGKPQMKMYYIADTEFDALMKYGASVTNDNDLYVCTKPCTNSSCPTHISMEKQTACVLYGRTPRGVTCTTALYRDDGSFVCGTHGDEKTHVPVCTYGGIYRICLLRGNGITRNG